MFPYSDSLILLIITKTISVDTQTHSDLQRSYVLLLVGARVAPFTAVQHGLVSTKAFRERRQNV